MAMSPVTPMTQAVPQCASSQPRSASAHTRSRGPCARPPGPPGPPEAPTHAIDLYGGTAIGFTRAGYTVRSVERGPAACPPMLAELIGRMITVAP